MNRIVEHYKLDDITIKIELAYTTPAKQAYDKKKIGKVLQALQSTGFESYNPYEEKNDTQNNY
jgi:hypothetical protein